VRVSRYRPAGTKTIPPLPPKDAAALSSAAWSPALSSVVPSPRTPNSCAATSMALGSSGRVVNTDAESAGDAAASRNRTGKSVLGTAHYRESATPPARYDRSVSLFKERHSKNTPEGSGLRAPDTKRVTKLSAKWTDHV